MDILRRQAWSTHLYPSPVVYLAPWQRNQVQDLQFSAQSRTGFQHHRPDAGPANLDCCKFLLAKTKTCNAGRREKIISGMWTIVEFLGLALSSKTHSQPRSSIFVHLSFTQALEGVHGPYEIRFRTGIFDQDPAGRYIQSSMVLPGCMWWWRQPFYSHIVVMSCFAELSRKWRTRDTFTCQKWHLWTIGLRMIFTLNGTTVSIHWRQASFIEDHS